MPTTVSVNRIGEVFGRLIVVSEGPRAGYCRRWVCLCTCGNDVLVRHCHLNRGPRGTKSCGCLQRERTTEANWKHGRRVRSKTPRQSRRKVDAVLYNTWKGMIRRCHSDNPSPSELSCYKERGIAVCDRWRESYEAFAADMGPRPSPEHSLDRRNNEGNYEPGNCRWATREEQMNNMRDNRVIEFAGESLTLSQWARRQGLSVKTLWGRIMIRHWPLDRALLSPARKRTRKS